MTSFYQRLESVWNKTGSLLCVGLDPKLEKIPAHLGGAKKPFLEFNKAIIDATVPYCCAFKPQFAYYAGEDRLDELKETINYIKSNYPDHLVILDSKRGDIGTTADEYAREAFEVYGADAVTVNPYMGGDTLQSYLKFGDKGVIILCKTSNSGSSEFQDLIASGMSIFEHVATRAAKDWNMNHNVALVVGATYPEELNRVRRIVGNIPLLVPGIGAQGGDLEATLQKGLTPEKVGLLINSSRGIIYKSSGEDFAEAAADAAKELNTAINEVRESL